MSQTWTDDCFAAGHVGQTDLANMENNFAALKSLFSGASQPASMAACHPWFDTTKHALKVRNDGDSAWVGLMHGDVSQKIWVYRNAAMSGWAIDSSVIDKVLALKGGSTYTAGGATAGSWTISAAAHAHTLKIGYYAGTIFMGGESAPGTDTPTTHTYTTFADTTALNAVVSWMKTETDGAISDATQRPAAAVGTLQYLDL